MTPENKKLLEDLSRTSYGRALSEFLKKELEELKDVSNATSWDDALGRKHATRIIERLFSFMEEKPKVNTNKTSFT
jgi:hypothetical protein